MSVLSKKKYALINVFEELLRALRWGVMTAGDVPGL